MDRRGALAALFLIAGGAAAPALPIKEAQWIDPPARLEALTRQPRECLALPNHAGTRAQVAVGRALFRTPLLLGGQAARAGLSCASCHANGRGNPHFRFPGISGPPGTADITASLFSSHRGDGKDNPVPIPDLAIDLPKISRDPADPALRAFIRGLIVEEFDGLEPPPAALDGLTAYVRALRKDACPAQPSEPRTLEGELGESALAVFAAEQMIAAGDTATARLLLAAARSSLGRADERLLEHKAARKRIAKLDDGLRDAQAALGGQIVPERLQIWAGEFGRARPDFKRAASGSLYHPEQVRKAMKGRSTSVSRVGNLEAFGLGT